MVKLMFSPAGAAPCRSVALIIALLSLATTQVTSAQRLQGRLVDLDSDEPIPNGTVTLLSSDRAPISTEVSDANGEWALEAPEPGIYFIETLLEPLRHEPLGRSVDWALVERFYPFGGIRIEDNVLVTRDGARNLTREAFAAA